MSMPEEECKQKKVRSNDICKPKTHSSASLRFVYCSADCSRAKYLNERRPGEKTLWYKRAGVQQIKTLVLYSGCPFWWRERCNSVNKGEPLRLGEGLKLYDLQTEWSRKEVIWLEAGDTADTAKIKHCDTSRNCFTIHNMLRHEFFPEIWTFGAGKKRTSSATVWKKYQKLWIQRLLFKIRH